MFRRGAQLVWNRFERFGTNKTMHTLLRDFRYTIRMLIKQKSFSVIAIAALTIGIGANTAIFSVVNQVLFRPLPFHDPAEIAVVLRKGPRSGNLGPVAPATFLDIRRQNRTFTSIGAAEMWGCALTGEGAPEQIAGLRMSSSIFDVLGMQPLLGRVFRADEEEQGKHRVAVLTHKLFQRRFGGDASIVGRGIVLHGETYTVIGVMPPEFQFPQFWATRAEIYIPLSFTPAQKANRTANSLRLFARLQPGIILEQAQADLSAIGARLATDFPQTDTNLSFGVRPMHEMIVGNVRPALLTLLVTVALVLLIACANVANLLLARGIARQKEIAVRTALGAGRMVIVRQLLTESVLLAAFAGLGGVILAAWMVDAMQAALGDAVPRLSGSGIDSQALLFALAASVLTGLLFGLAPARLASNPDVSSTLKENSRGVHGGSGFLRRVLVAGEVALTVMLLIGAGLLARSFVNMLRLDPGFRPENLLTAHVNVAGTTVMERERQMNFYRTTLDRAASLPGVLSAAAINHLPLAGDTWSTTFLLDDRPEPAPGESFRAVYRVISPGYFKTMGTRLLRGREFDGTDVNPETPAVVINKVMAERYWPSQNPLGKRLRTDTASPWMKVIGVIQNVRQREWTTEAVSECYFNYLQAPGHFRGAASSAMTFVMRTSGDPHAAVKPLEDIVWSQDPRIPFVDIATMDEVVTIALRQPRVYTFILGVFAFVALSLATLGIYGVISYSVAQRTQEMGVRMAVGASPRDLIRLVLGGGLKVVGLGVVVGLALSLALSRVIAKLLFGIQPDDLVTICGVAAVVFTVAIVASYVPARRISRIDPVSALRIE
jgi:putative ABC transport system permease protein